MKIRKGATRTALEADAHIVHVWARDLKVGDVLLGNGGENKITEIIEECTTRGEAAYTVRTDNFVARLHAYNVLPVIRPGKGNCFDA